MYVTDALTVADKVKLIPVPAWAQPPVRYQIAIVKKHEEPRRRGGVHQAPHEHGRPQAAGRERLRRAEAAAGEEAREEEEVAAAGQVSAPPAPGERLPAVARRRLARAGSSTSSTASPSATRPGSTTQQSSATRPPNERTMRRSTPRVLLERVGVERRHHAARAAVADADQDAPGTQAIAGPVDLLEPLGARDHDVRAEAAAVDADRLDHPVVTTVSGSTS